MQNGNAQKLSPKYNKQHQAKEPPSLFHYEVHGIPRIYFVITFAQNSSFNVSISNVLKRYAHKMFHQLQ
jgi:hypothetical protein